MTRAKLIKRATRSRQPDTGWPAGCFVVVLVALVIPGAAVAAAGLPWLGVLLAMPAGLVLGHWFFGRVLLLAALVAWRTRGIRGVLVHSDSPTWSAHIDREWLPKFGDRFVRLNWSERNQWRLSLSVLLWRHFCGHYPGGNGYWHNFNPAVILLRGLSHPRVYRFYGAFEAAKHGELEPLKTMEADLGRWLA